MQPSSPHLAVSILLAAPVSLLAQSPASAPAAPAPAPNFAAYESDSTRRGIDASVEYLGAALKGEYLGRHRDAGGLDDKGWYGRATYRVLPWVQLVFKQEDFRRSEIGDALRNQATTGGVNVEFSQAKVSPRNPRHAPGPAHHAGAGEVLRRERGIRARRHPRDPGRASSSPSVRAARRHRDPGRLASRRR